MAPSFLLIILCLCVLLPGESISGSKDVLRSADQELLDHLLTNYDYMSRPVENTSTPVSVGLALTVNSITALNEREQLFVANTWLTHRWSDPRIRWSPKMFQGRKTLRVSSRNLWMPDIVLYNRADDLGKPTAQVNVVTSYDGRLYWIPPSITQSHCAIEVFLFPFDIQVCPLRYGSWTYDVSQLELYSTEKVDLYTYIESGEWAIVNISVRKNYQIYTSYDHTYAAITFFICITRKSLYYWVNIFVPTVCLNLLCIVSFLVPPLTNGRIVLSITTMISYFVYGNLISSTLPRSRIIPVMGIYLFMSMSISVWSVVFSVIAVRLFSDRQAQLEVPQWLRYLLLDRCACIRGPPTRKENSVESALLRFYTGHSKKPTWMTCFGSNFLKTESTDDQAQTTRKQGIADKQEPEMSNLLTDMLLLTQAHQQHKEKLVNHHNQRTHLTTDIMLDANEGNLWFKLGVIINFSAFMFAVTLFVTAIVFFLYMYYLLLDGQVKLDWCQQIIDRRTSYKTASDKDLIGDFSV